LNRVPFNNRIIFGADILNQLTNRRTILCPSIVRYLEALSFFIFWLTHDESAKLCSSPALIWTNAYNCKFLIRNAHFKIRYWLRKLHVELLFKLQNHLFNWPCIYWFKWSRLIETSIGLPVLFCFGSKSKS
jgi:hypothetical protein